MDLHERYGQNIQYPARNKNPPKGVSVPRCEACGKGKSKSTQPESGNPIQTDRRGEFGKKELLQWCEQGGTRIQETIPHHSETYAVVERLTREVSRPQINSSRQLCTLDAKIYFENETDLTD